MAGVPAIPCPATPVRAGVQRRINATFHEYVRPMDTYFEPSAQMAGTGAGGTNSGGNGDRVKVCTCNCGKRGTSNPTLERNCGDFRRTSEDFSHFLQNRRSLQGLRFQLAPSPSRHCGGLVDQH
jgi:hypothetical protein